MKEFLESIWHAKYRQLYLVLHNNPLFFMLCMFWLLRGLEEWIVLLLDLNKEKNALCASFNLWTIMHISLKIPNSSVCISGSNVLCYECACLFVDCKLGLDPLIWCETEAVTAPYAQPLPSLLQLSRTFHWSRSPFHILHHTNGTKSCTHSTIICTHTHTYKHTQYIFITRFLQ